MLTCCAHNEFRSGREDVCLKTRSSDATETARQTACVCVCGATHLRKNTTHKESSFAPWYHLANRCTQAVHHRFHNSCWFHLFVAVFPSRAVPRLAHPMRLRMSRPSAALPARVHLRPLLHLAAWTRAAERAARIPCPRASFPPPIPTAAQILFFFDSLYWSRVSYCF